MKVCRVPGFLYEVAQDHSWAGSIHRLGKPAKDKPKKKVEVKAKKKKSGLKKVKRKAVQPITFTSVTLVNGLDNA